VIHLRYVSAGAYDDTGRSFFSSLIDYIAVSGSMERNVLEFVDHLHEHFVTPCSINSAGRYNVPTNPKEGYRFVAALFCQHIVENNNRRRTSIEMHKTSVAEYEWPNGSYWVGARKNKA
jgi:L-fuconate dehydratase